MKKTVLGTFLIFLLTTASHAQTDKGTWLLGGNVSFNSVESTSSFVAAANIGYFVANKIAVGGQAALYTSEGTTDWSVGPFARFYFTNNEKAKPFVGVNVGVNGFDGGDTEFGFGGSAGYSIFLNKSIALELAVNYTRAGEVDRIGVGAGFQIHFHK